MIPGRIVHVNGPTEEHRSGKVHHRWDAEVDLDWQGDYTLDVQKNSSITYVGELKQDTTQKVEIFNHATLGVTTDGATTVSDKTSLTHFIGSEAGAGGATHFLNVEGTQTVHVTDKQTVTVDADQEWTTVPPRSSTRQRPGSVAKASASCRD